MERPTIEKLIEHNKEQCNKYAHGECRIRRCLMMGGYSGRGPVPDGIIATCEEREMVLALEELADFRQDFRNRELESSDDS